MAVGVVALCSIAFCDLSRVRVSPLFPDLNLSKAPRDSSRCNKGSRHPGKPSLSLGLVTDLKQDHCCLSREHTSL